MAPKSNLRVEFQVSVPEDLEASYEAFESFLLSLSFCRYPVSFELVGTADAVRVVIAADERDASGVESQLAAHFPDVVINRESILEEQWCNAVGERLVVADALSRECMLPLTNHEDLICDPLVTLVAAALTA